MRLPANVEYGYKAVLELSIRYKGDGPIQISTICDSQGIPKKFLVQILLRLKNAHIVNSTRGIAGGYHLSRPPSHISLADVIKAIDESILESPRKAKAGKASDSDRLILKVWDNIGKEMIAHLKEITFDKLAAQIKNEEFTYQI